MSGWPWVELRDVVQRSVQTVDPRRNPDREFSYVDISSIDNSRKVISSPRRLLGRHAPSRARQIVRTRDILVATTRPNLNAVAQIPLELDQEVCSTGFCVLRPTEQVDSDFLFAWVRHPAFVDALAGLVQGALYPAVKDGDVLAQRMPLPPLAEQRRIAAQLESQLEATARVHSSVAERLASAEVLRHRIVSRFFDREPDYHRASLRSLGTLTDGDWILTADYSREGVRLLQVGDIGSGTIRLKSSRYVSIDRAKELNCTMLAPGDVLISRMPEPLGRACVLPDLGYPAITAVDVTVFRPNDQLLDREFATFYMNSQRWLSDVASKASGATRPRISRKNLELTRIPAPDLSEQRQVVMALREQLIELETATASIDKELEAVEALPAALLRQAFGNSAA